jgi:hypothetical protein
MTYSIQITIHSLNFFTVETFTNAEEMFARYSELISEASDDIEVECMVK